MLTKASSQWPSSASRKPVARRSSHFGAQRRWRAQIARPVRHGTKWRPPIQIRIAERVRPQLEPAQVRQMRVACSGDPLSLPGIDAFS